MAVNGKVTLAKVEQRLEDHIIQQEKDFIDVKSDLKVVVNSISDIKQILVEGDGKIKRNFMLFEKHIKSHKFWITTSIALCVLITAIGALVVSAYA